MHADGWGGPGAGLVLVEAPAAAAVVAGVLVEGDGAVDLGHGVDDVAHVLLRGHRRPVVAPRAEAVRRQHRRRPRAPHAVRRVAYRPDPRHVRARRAPAPDRLRERLPEPRPVLQRYLARRRRRHVCDRAGYPRRQGCLGESGHPVNMLRARTGFLSW